MFVAKYLHLESDFSTHGAADAIDVVATCGATASMQVDIHPEDQCYTTQKCKTCQETLTVTETQTSQFDKSGLIEALWIFNKEQYTENYT